ncbi:hypothetical protein IJH74_01520 [Candidatus Saccharibacteria bacterium]|nr:hypothetical protein [Candidatus Saccharibacteria bacterium]
MIKKNIIISFILAVIVTTCLSAQVFADPPSEGGGGSSTGGSGTPCTTGYCYGANRGASLAHYLVNLDIYGATEAGGEGNKIRMPKPLANGGSYSDVRIGHCARVGATDLYFLGALGERPSGFTGEQISAVKFGDLKMYNGNYVYRSSNEIGSEPIANIDGLSGETYVDEGEVSGLLNDFREFYRKLPDKRKEIMKQDGLDPEGNPEWYKNTTWFCMTDNPSGGGESGWHSQSYAKAEDKKSEGVLDGTSSLNVTVDKDKSSVQVTFHHELAMMDRDDYKDVKVETSWKVTQGSSKQVGSGTANTQGGSWKSGSGGAEGYQVIEVNKNTATVNVPNSGSVTVCQTITYNKQDFEVSGNKVTKAEGDSRKSKACVVVSKDDAPEEIDVCSTFFPDVDIDENYGDTEGHSKVVNYSQTPGASLTSTNDNEWKKLVYAKPSDEVQFRHALCFGAQKVTVDPSGTNRQAGKITANEFEITASPDDDYLFNILNEGTTIKKGVARDPKIKAGKQADWVSDYGIAIFSPNLKSKGAFNCSDYGIGSLKKYSYQIPGFGDERCEVTDSDVGKEFSQTMEYNEVRAWINEKYHTEGSCGCDEDTAELETDSVDSYPKGGSIGNFEFGRYKKYECKKSGECNCYTEGEGEDEEEICPDPEYSLEDSGVVAYPYEDEEKDVSNTATVKVPYNFNTSAESSILTGGDVLFGGEEVTSSFKVKIHARSNPLVSSEDYMTITPDDTEIEVAEFLIKPDADSSFVSGSNNAGIGNLCDFVNSEYCVPIDYDGGPYNENGKLKGSKKAYSNEITRRVPDVEVGYKYCVAVGISHSDSHGKPDQGLSESDGANSLSMGDTNPNWRVSNVSCRTIAKKPNFQVWGGVYTQGSIGSTISNKKFDASGNYINNLYGSWVDTLAVAGGSVRGFASGAGYGYDPSNGGGTSYNINYCGNLDKMTIANNNCSNYSSSAGYSGNIQASTQSLLDRILSRYSIPNTTSAQTFSQELSGGAKYFHSRNSINLHDLLSQNTGTSVVKVDGTLYITENICSGGGTCPQNNSAFIIGDRNNQLHYNITSLAQMILIADNVVISPNVTQIDAWIFANNNLNTCEDGHASADTCNNPIIFNGPVFAQTITLNRTGGAYPGRNAIGSAFNSTDLSSRNRSTSIFTNNTAYGSETPAEIFNLRPDAYFWAHNQANRLTQATVVYMRELAPRY